MFISEMVENVSIVGIKWVFHLFHSITLLLDAEEEVPAGPMWFCAAYDAILKKVANHWANIKGPCSGTPMPLNLIRLPPLILLIRLRRRSHTYRGETTYTGI
jgi:hypothetical protein